MHKLQGELTGKLKNGGLTELINHVGIPQAVSRPIKDASSGTAEGRASDGASGRVGIPAARYLEWWWVVVGAVVVGIALICAALAAEPFDVLRMMHTSTAGKPYNDASAAIYAAILRDCRQAKERSAKVIPNSTVPANKAAPKAQQAPHGRVEQTSKFISSMLMQFVTKPGREALPFPAGVAPNQPASAEAPAQPISAGQPVQGGELFRGQPAPNASDAEIAEWFRSQQPVQGGPTYNTGAPPDTTCLQGQQPPPVGPWFTGPPSTQQQPGNIWVESCTEIPHGAAHSTQQQPGNIWVESCTETPHGAAPEAAHRPATVPSATHSASDMPAKLTPAQLHEALQSELNKLNVMDQAFSEVNHLNSSDGLLYVIQHTIHQSPVCSYRLTYSELQFQLICCWLKLIIFTV